MSDLAKTIDDAFEKRDDISPPPRARCARRSRPRSTCSTSGEARVAEKRRTASWQVNQWLKKAVLLSFRLNDMSPIAGGRRQAAWWDKVPSKFEGWGENRFRDAGFRAVPGCDRAPLGLHRAERRADAVASSISAPMSTEARWSIPGRRSAPARRSARTATSPAASASAACWSRCRPAR